MDLSETQLEHFSWLNISIHPIAHQQQNNFFQRSTTPLQQQSVNKNTKQNQKVDTTTTTSSSVPTNNSFYSEDRNNYSTTTGFSSQTNPNNSDTKTTRHHQTSRNQSNQFQQQIFTSEQLFLDTQLVINLVEPLGGQINKVVPKPHPYQNSCFLKMDNVVDAANVKKALNGKILKLNGSQMMQCFLEVKFFPPPGFKYKFADQVTKEAFKTNEMKEDQQENFDQNKSSSLISEEQRTYKKEGICEPIRFIGQSHENGCETTEMRDYMIMSQPELSGAYQNYLQLVQPDIRIDELQANYLFKTNNPKANHHNLSSLNQSKLDQTANIYECILLFPVYCHHFAFTSQFIGTHGKYIKEIRTQSCHDIVINVSTQQNSSSTNNQNQMYYPEQQAEYPIMQVYISGPAPETFVTAVRLCQERMVQIMEMFTLERTRKVKSFQSNLKIQKTSTKPNNNSNIGAICCKQRWEQEDPMAIFVQAFYPQHTQEALDMWQNLWRVNYSQINTFKANQILQAQVQAGFGNHFAQFQATNLNFNNIH